MYLNKNIITVIQSHCVSPQMTLNTLIFNNLYVYHHFYIGDILIKSLKYVDNVDLFVQYHNNKYIDDYQKFIILTCQYSRTNVFFYLLSVCQMTEETHRSVLKMSFVLKNFDIFLKIFPFDNINVSWSFSPAISICYREIRNEYLIYSQNNGEYHIWKILSKPDFSTLYKLPAKNRLVFFKKILENNKEITLDQLVSSMHINVQCLVYCVRNDDETFLEKKQISNSMIYLLEYPIIVTPKNINNIFKNSIIYDNCDLIDYLLSNKKFSDMLNRDKFIFYMLDGKNRNEMILNFLKNENYDFEKRVDRKKFSQNLFLLAGFDNRNNGHHIYDFFVNNNLLFFDKDVLDCSISRLNNADKTIINRVKKMYELANIPMPKKFKKMIDKE